MTEITQKPQKNKRILIIIIGKLEKTFERYRLSPVLPHLVRKLYSEYSKFQDFK